MKIALVLLVRYSVLLCILAALIGVGIRLARAPSDRKRCEWFIGACALALPANVLSEGCAFMLSWLRPLKMDQFVFDLDSHLGFQPSFLIGRFVEHHIWLKIAASIGYSILPCAVLGVFAVYLWNRERGELLMLIRTFAFNLFLSVPIFLLFPVCGPVYAFQGFPFREPHHLVPHWIPLTASPNCIPSVHMSTALLILWFARHWGLGRVLGVSYVALMIIATLGSGQHYWFDLVVAVPYTLFILLIGKIEWVRRPKAAMACSSRTRCGHNYERMAHVTILTRPQ